MSNNKNMNKNNFSNKKIKKITSQYHVNTPTTIKIIIIVIRMKNLSYKNYKK